MPLIELPSDPRAAPSAGTVVERHVPAYLVEAGIPREAAVTPGNEEGLARLALRAGDPATGAGEEGAEVASRLAVRIRQRPPTRVETRRHCRLCMAHHQHLHGKHYRARCRLRDYGGRVLPAPTPRLRFREMTDADLPGIETLEIGGSRGPAGWIEWNRRNYAEHGFGLWVVETHHGAVGDCGITMQEVEGEWYVESGWHVRADLRRQGFAAEAAVAVREVARGAGVTRLIAIVRPHNVASQGVAARIGMTFEREIHKYGGPALVFGLDLTD